MKRLRKDWEDWLTDEERRTLRAIETKLARQKAAVNATSRAKAKLCSTACSRRWQTEEPEAYRASLRRYEDKRRERRYEDERRAGRVEGSTR